MTDSGFAVLLTVLAGALALLCWWRSHAANRGYRLVEALPTSRTQGVFIGLVELKGTAEGQPFLSYLTEQECLLYSWSVSEEWQRTVTETYQDAEGRTQTRHRVESGWTTVASGGESRPFYLQDETGAVLIHPEGAIPFVVGTGVADGSVILWKGAGGRHRRFDGAAAF